MPQPDCNEISQPGGLEDGAIAQLLEEAQAQGAALHSVVQVGAGGAGVATIVYFPLRTQLLREARSAGCRTVNGSGMAIFQAVHAFEIVTGRVADSERTRRQFALITAG